METEEGVLATDLTGWSWQSFCKTQYAGDPKAGGTVNFLRCHVTVVRLLDRAEEMGILQSVADEGHFWESRDVKALAETVGQWNAQIAAIVGKFKDQTRGEIVAPIAEYPNFEHLEADGLKARRHDPKV